MMNTTSNKWYILRGENKYGPFEYEAMIRMLQKNELYDYNYVWAPHMEEWRAVGDVPDFSRDRLTLLMKEQNAPVQGAFSRRETPRADVHIPVYGHDERQLFDGHAVSVSIGGSLLLLNSPVLQPNQEVFLHFRAGGDNAEPFTARAAIVRKNFTRGRINVKSGLYYAVRFIDYSPNCKQIISRLVEEHTKEAQ